jgi:NAD(P)-dependent dehydrogenase (short-subunit alcohol dehydrogenase family)/acyl dehydratase/acyl carrier protein
MRFEEFSVGDYVTFSRHFGKREYRVFRQISGDSNPLHHDDQYAAASKFGRTIVPLHLIAAPLSAIAGMHFPGDPSLYLGHELRAIAPVYFGDRLTYSARIVAINVGFRVLTLSVLVLRDTDVVIEGQMRVQSRQEEWPNQPDFIRAGASHALVTGATGSIGTAIALELARRGWRLSLNARRDSDELQSLITECGDLGSEVHAIVGDLAVRSQRATVARYLHQGGSPSVLVHAASPRMDSGLDRLSAVNYLALREMTEAMLPAALSRQDGAILMIGSTALGHYPAGWDDYVAAKAMSAAYVDSVSKRYARYGVRGLMLSPGFVRTSFSAAWRQDGMATLLPEQVAETAADMLAAGTGSNGHFLWLEPNSAEYGTWGFQPAGVRGRVTAVPEHAGEVPADAKLGGEELESMVRQLLKLPPGVAMNDAGLGRTPGWDSLRHIELVLGIERAYGIKFTAAEIEQTREYAGLVSLWQQKVRA